MSSSETPSSSEAHSEKKIQEKKPSFFSIFLSNLKTSLSNFIPSLKQNAREAKSATLETLEGVKSEDAVTRNASRWFVVFLLLALFVVLKAGLFVYEKNKLKQKERERIAQIEVERLRKVEEEKMKLLPPPFVSLGGFSLELKEVSGVYKLKNSLNSAEMEIVVTCEKLELCDWIKENIPLMRAELGPLFVPTDRERILSPNGKRAFREEIRDQLNRYFDKRETDPNFEKRGRIIEVLLPRFIVS